MQPTEIFRRLQFWLRKKMGILDSFSLKGKNALIIGGSKGIGKGITIGLAEAGATVIIASRNLETCKALAKDIKCRTGADAKAISIGICNQKKIAAVISKLITEIGEIHILVNSAGINIRKPALEYTSEDWDTVQNAQLKGVFFACQTVAQHMVEKKITGKIINIASINAKIVARPHIVAYIAAKAGIMQMTKALAVEWADYNIRVNAIAPGWFKTDLTSAVFKDLKTQKDLLKHIPMKRFGNPEKDIAGMVIYYASDASQYTTGQMICIDGGYTII